MKIIKRNANNILSNMLRMKLLTHLIRKKIDERRSSFFIDYLIAHTFTFYLATLIHKCPFIHHTYRRIYLTNIN